MNRYYYWVWDRLAFKKKLHFLDIITAWKGQHQWRYKCRNQDQNFWRKSETKLFGGYRTVKNRGKLQGWNTEEIKQIQSFTFDFRTLWSICGRHWFCNWTKLTNTTTMSNFIRLHEPVYIVKWSVNSSSSHRLPVRTFSSKLKGNR